MPRRLKSAQPKAKRSDDAVRQTVERMLAEIAEEGDDAGGAAGAGRWLVLPGPQPFTSVQAETHSE